MSRKRKRKPVGVADDWGVADWPVADMGASPEMEATPDMEASPDMGGDFPELDLSELERELDGMGAAFDADMEALEKAFDMDTMDAAFDFPDIAEPEPDPD